ncbi:hypothetical protein [Paraburkholderia sediminicola]|uniref:hypothetical protein n=1 Tax=Paraburkholderia sediminicola TaxID=458836 RepID=UPI0038B84A73
MKRVYIYAVGLALVFLVLLGLIVWQRNKVHSTFVPENANAGEADVARIAQVCAMGGHFSVDSKVQAGIAKYLSDLQGGATVSTQDVGALVEKITSDQQGVALYRAYTDCLNQQMAIVLQQRGIHITAPAGSQIENEEQIDKRVLDKVSMLMPDTPPQRLAEILGQPISIQDFAGGVQFALYQYKYYVFVAEYSRKGHRLGIGVAIQVPSSMGDHDLLAKTTLKDVDRCYYGENDKGGVRIDGRALITTGICGGDHASNWIYLTYFFYPGKTTCDLFKGDAVRPKLTKECPELGTLKPLAVAMSRGTDDLVKVRRFFADELNFGHTFKWVSPEEEAAEGAKSAPSASEAAE